jgi:hypothetical protein
MCSVSIAIVSSGWDIRQVRLHVDGWLSASLAPCTSRPRQGGVWIAVFIRALWANGISCVEYTAVGAYEVRKSREMNNHQSLKDMLVASLLPERSYTHMGHLI